MYVAGPPNDERSLVLRLIDGNEDAFCELYAAYKNRLIYFAMRFLKSREYAEDVFQDAFTIIWQGRRFINPDASFSSYLYTIVRNRILNQLRDLVNQDKLKEQILQQAVDYSNDTQNEILANDLKQLISCAMQQLTPRQRKIFEMSREQQMSHKEIADVLEHFSQYCTGVDFHFTKNSPFLFKEELYGRYRSHSTVRLLGIIVHYTKSWHLIDYRRKG